MENLIKKESFLSLLKRFSAFVMAFLLSFITIAPSLKAETGRTEWLPGFYYNAGTYGQMTKLTIDGEDVFCLEPNKVFHAGTYSKGDIDSILSESQRDRIELIHHFGYILNGKGDKNRAFTQVAIWETVSNYTVEIGSKKGSNNLRGEYEAWLSDVENKINSVMQLPSWNGSTIKGKVGETITLDGEGKIENSKILDSNGSSVSIEDGKIKIGITENSLSGNIALRKNIPNYEDSDGVTLLYTKSGSQKVGKIRLDVDPPKYIVNLEVAKEPTKARILKVGESGEAVAGAIFEMSYTEDFSTTIYEYTTGADGYTEFDTWNWQGQKVYVREKSVPAPYIKSDEVKSFTVTENGNVELKFVNKKQKGKLKLAKVGEKLKEYKDEKVTVRDKTYNVKTPVFEKAFIAGGKFDIKQNGKVIETVVSKEEFVEIELPVGKYQVEEKEAPAGYIKTDKVYDVDLTGAEEIVVKSLEIENEREKIKLNLTKSFEKGIFKNETYAVFGLFTKEKGILEKDTLLEVLEFDKENSTKEFKNTIKGKYYIKELDNSSGYKKDEKEHEVDLTKEKAATKTIINKLKRGGIKIVKVDAENKEIKLKGVKFRLLANNEEKKEIGVYTTDDEGEANIENLETGEYILEEIETKEGYILDETKRVIRVKEDNKITMEIVENDFTKVEISKTDITGEKELVGAKLKVVDSEGKTVDEWVSEEKPHLITKIKPGEYKLKEEIAPDGYVIANEITFEVKATKEIQKVVMKDDTTKVKVHKVGKDDETKQLEGAEFVIEEVEETKEDEVSEVDKKEVSLKNLGFLDEKHKFLSKKENLIEDLEKIA